MKSLTAAGLALVAMLGTTTAHAQPFGGAAYRGDLGAAMFTQTDSFSKGLADRAGWEQWLGSLTGSYHDGALYWSGQRSLAYPGSCVSSDLNLQAGCVAASNMLARPDIERKSDPRYRAGWNSYSATTSVAPPVYTPPPPTQRAAAGEAPLWSRSSYWEIRSDPTTGGCFMQVSYGSTTVRFGIRHDPGRVGVGYLMLTDPQWYSLVHGQSYTVQIKFDNVPGFGGWATWTGVAHKMGDDRSMVLELDFNNPDVWKGIMLASTVHVVYQGRSIVDGNLPGSTEAAGALLNCQTAYNASVGGPADPFAGG